MFCSELQRRQEELEALEAQRLQRRQQQQQLMGGGPLAGWEPQMVDGPMGRNFPPTFGPGGTRPPMPAFGGQQLGLGPGHQLGQQHVEREREQQNVGGMLQNGRDLSPQGMFVEEV